MAEEAVAAGKVRAQLVAARNYLEQARRTYQAAQVNRWTHGELPDDFGSIERQCAQLRVRRWEDVVAKLEELARFMGASTAP